MPDKAELEHRLKTLQKDIQDLRLQHDATNKALEFKSKELNRTNQILNNMSRELRCSDHALIRYLERKAGVDMEEARAMFIAMIPANMRVLNNFKVTTGDGVVLVVKDKTIVTIV